MASSKGPILALQNREELFSLSRLQKLLPEDVCYDTLKLWCTAGRRRKKNDPSSIVKMESVMRPSGRASSVEAYWRFLSAFNDE